MAQQGKSGKRVVAVLLALVFAAALAAWFGAMQVEKNNHSTRDVSGGERAVVLSEGILYEATAGDGAVLTAKDVGSGKELWRAELGNIAGEPVLSVTEELIEVQIAGTPWMKLDRSTGEPVE